jgi:uncharacterized membrane protein
LALDTMLLRVIHIFSGVFWVGFAIFNIGFLQPAVKATGAEGLKVMQYLSGKTRLMPSIYAAATLTVLSGLIMYWPMAGSGSFMNTGYGLVLTIGATAGIIGWLIAIISIRGVINGMGAVGKEMAIQEGPPSPDQMANMQALSARLSKIGHIALVFMSLSLLAMSIARYTPNF